jgi:hypothetical protein
MEVWINTNTLCCVFVLLITTGKMVSIKDKGEEEECKKEEKRKGGLKGLT